MSSISPALAGATHGAPAPARTAGHAPRPAATQAPAAPAEAPASGKRVDIKA